MGFRKCRVAVSDEEQWLKTESLGRSLIGGHEGAELIVWRCCVEKLGGSRGGGCCLVSVSHGDAYIVGLPMVVIPSLVMLEKEEGKKNESK